MVATADVDYFKEYNDTYGHIAGDLCLKCVADILRQNIGDEGIICRYGGDEFLCVMSNISQAQAEQLFSKISAGLADKYIENSQSGVSDRVTISIGAVIAKQSAAMDFETLIHEADMALYEVKMSGKNGCMAYREGERIKSRAKLGFAVKDIIDNMPGAFIVYRADKENDEILLANNELLRLTGCKNMDELLAYTIYLSE